MADFKHKIGIMGGTFDPIHIGHLILAEAAYEQLKLEKVMFIPSGKPPHKPNRNTGSLDGDRVEMTRLAIKGNEAFELDGMEMNSQKPTYSYLTMKRLCDEHPENEYFFIIGEDSLVDFTAWKHPEELVKYCHIVVGVRPGSSDEAIEETIKRTRSITGGDFILIKSPALEISSSELRKRISNGLPIRYFVSEPVYKYIEEIGLYKER